MNNTTANQTNATGNTTATNTIVDTLLDLLGANQEALLIVGVATAGGSLAYYKVPQVREFADTYLPMVYVRALAAKFLKRHGAEVDGLINANLTKLQMAVFEGLDAQMQKQVRDDVRNALAKARGESK